MDRINISHGSGGKTTHLLIKDTFFKYFDNDILAMAEDSAIVGITGGEIAFTTDSFVVKPIFFPGGDIGKLAVCGTVNDLAVNGAVPKYITCGFIIEEGFSIGELDTIAKSMGEWAAKAGVKIVAGDTKVVGKGEADGIFINTSGVGALPRGRRTGISRIKPGDKIIITGTVGDHGIAVLSKRKGLDFGTEIQSDAAPLNKMLGGIMESMDGIRFMRDPTRGGLATTLNEIVGGGAFGIKIEERDVPVAAGVNGACELLGLDPLYLANEGKAVVIVDPVVAERCLKALRLDEYGRSSAVIGEITKENAGKVCLVTKYGTTRILDMLTAEHLPRIC